MRTARLEGPQTTTTLDAAANAQAILEDLVVAPSGAAAVAWSTTDPFGTALPGFVATAPAGGSFGETQQLPGDIGAVGIRLAYEPRGLLAAWSARTRLTGAAVAAELR